MEPRSGEVRHRGVVDSRPRAEDGGQTSVAAVAATARFSEAVRDGKREAIVVVVPCGLCGSSFLSAGFSRVDSTCPQKNLQLGQISHKS